MFVESQTGLGSVLEFLVCLYERASGDLGREGPGVHGAAPVGRTILSERIMSAQNRPGVVT